MSSYKGHSIFALLLALMFFHNPLLIALTFIGANIPDFDHKFKKDHDYDPESKTIQMDDGKRVSFRYINDGNHKNEKSVPRASINHKSQSPTITMNKKSFNKKAESPGRLQSCVSHICCDV